MSQDGGSLVLATFAETKGARLQGRNPASTILFKKTRLKTSGHARAHEYAHAQVLVLSLLAHSQL